MRCYLRTLIAAAALVIVPLSVSWGFGGGTVADNNEAERRTFEIVVDFSDAKLELIGDGVLIAAYPVVLPRIEPQLPATGIVRQIVVGAWWYPTEKTRAAYYRRYGRTLSAKIPPGDPQNAMGAGKILVTFTEGSIDPSVRIHGTKDSSLLRQRVSRGCIRLRDEDFLALASIVGGSPATVRFVL